MRGLNREMGDWENNNSSASSTSSGSKRYITLFNLPDVEEDIAKLFHSKIDTLLFNEETNQSQGTNAVITGNDPKHIITSLERIIIQMKFAIKTEEIEQLIKFCTEYIQRLKNIKNEMIENEMEHNPDATTREIAIQILVDRVGPQLGKRIKNEGGYRRSRKSRKSKKSKKSRKSRKARKTRSR